MKHSDPTELKARYKSDTGFASAVDAARYAQNGSRGKDLLIAVVAGVVLSSITGGVMVYARGEVHSSELQAIQSDVSEVKSEVRENRKNAGVAKAAAEENGRRIIDVKNAIGEIDRKLERVLDERTRRRR